MLGVHVALLLLSVAGLLPLCRALACRRNEKAGKLHFSGSRAKASTTGRGNDVAGEPEIKWTLMPGRDGEVRVGILSGLEPPEMGSGSDVNFFLWTRDNPFMAERQVLNETCSPKFKYFNERRQTKIMVHGFGDAAKDSLMFPLMKDALLANGDYNVMAVDWAKLAAAPWYHVAAANTLLAAEQTARMIDHLVEGAGARVQDFHLLGFSLGAHVVGIAGQNVKSGRISRITGLDPAQVLYQSVPNEMRLDRSDADLVEVIHTSGGYLAFLEPLGHRDFFPNGGFWPQPGCVLDFVAVCSHQRAYHYLAEAIKTGTGFAATTCSDWGSYRRGACSGNDRIPLWNNYNSSVSGKFFLDTNNEEPFSKDR